MNDVFIVSLKTIVYRMIRKPALWCGRFVYHSEMRKKVQENSDKWEDILLDKGKTRYYRLKVKALKRHAVEMERTHFRTKTKKFKTKGIIK